LFALWSWRCTISIASLVLWWMIVDILCAVRVHKSIFGSMATKFGWSNICLHSVVHFRLTVCNSELQSWLVKALAPQEDSKSWNTSITFSKLNCKSLGI
jgi:hypothetical protein